VKLFHAGVFKICISDQCLFDCSVTYPADKIKMAAGFIPQCTACFYNCIFVIAEDFPGQTIRECFVL
jgi:hypothetical protein